MMAEVRKPKRKITQETIKRKRLSDRVRDKARVNLGKAFSPWRELRDVIGFKTDAEFGFFLLDFYQKRQVTSTPRKDAQPLPVSSITQESGRDRCAAFPQTHETSRGRRPLIKKDIPDPTPHSVCVNIACLLQLFQQCGQCSGGCVVRKQGDKRHFTVIRHCRTCNLLTTWASQPFKEDEESVDLHVCEVAEGNQEFTASLVLREWFDSKTDTASCKEESLLTAEDTKMIKIAELTGAEVSVVLPCEMRDGDQESTASMMMTMRSQTDGERSRKTGLLTEDEKNGEAQESENTFNPFTEVELTIDSDFSDESLRSQEDSDKGEEKVEEGKEAEEKGENIKKEEEEAENTAESETEEEDECEMDDDEKDSEWEMDDDEEESDEEVKVRKVRKRLRVWPGPNGQYRREFLMKKEQKRQETLCPDCGRLYKTLTHRSCDHKKKFQCPECGVFFLTELSLRVHGNNHRRSGSHHHTCTFCLKSFKTRQDKRTHEMSHSVSEFPYECPECPRRFCNRRSRSHHLKVHPRIFKCQTCQKEFPNLCNLQRHELSHSADKPFKCQMCDREFAQASQLKSHMRVHTGEKPFKCQLCPKCFTHNISLKNHIRRYHPGESNDGPALGEGAGESNDSPGPALGEGAGESNDSPALGEGAGESNDSPAPALGEGAGESTTTAQN